VGILYKTSYFRGTGAAQHWTAHYTTSVRPNVSNIADERHDHSTQHYPENDFVLTAPGQVHAGKSSERDDGMTHRRHCVPLSLLHGFSLFLGSLCGQDGTAGWSIISGNHGSGTGKNGGNERAASERSFCVCVCVCLARRGHRGRRISLRFESFSRRRNSSRQ